MAGTGVWRILVTVLVSLVVATMPLAVADTVASSQGQFSIGAQAPSVVSITFYDASKTTTVTAFTPGQQYWLEIQVSDLNTMDDIATIEVKFYYGDNSSVLSPVPLTTSTSDYVILKYERTPYSDQPGTWAFYYANGTKIGTTFGTWAIVDQSDPTNWAISTGTFAVKIQIGKVAHEANDGIVAGDWNIRVVVTDNDDLSSTEATNHGYTMNWYGEIAVNPTGFDFGSVAPESSNNPIQDNNGHLDVYVVSNGNYDVNIRTDTQWVGVANSNNIVNVTTTMPSAGQILLKISSTNDATSAMAIPPGVTYSIWLNDQSGPTQDGSAQSGHGAHHYAYIWLDVGSNIPQDTYVGNVYFQVTNG